MLHTKFWVNWPFRSGGEGEKLIFKAGHHCSYLGFQFGTILATFDKSPQCFLPSFEWFPIGTILATFDLQVIPILPTKLRVNWPFVQEKKRKTNFQDGLHCSHLGFPIGTILANFDLQVTQMLPTKFRVNWPFGSGGEAINRISIKDDRHGGHLWFPIGTILYIYYLHVTSMLPTKFRVSWPFGSGEEAKNRLSRWPHSGHFWFSIGTIFSLPGRKLRVSYCDHPLSVVRCGPSSIVGRPSSTISLLTL